MDVHSDANTGMFVLLNPVTCSVLQLTHIKTCKTNTKHVRQTCKTNTLNICFKTSKCFFFLKMMIWAETQQLDQFKVKPNTDQHHLLIIPQQQTDDRDQQPCQSCVMWTEHEPLSCWNFDTSVTDTLIQTMVCWTASHKPNWLVSGFTVPTNMSLEQSLLAVGGVIPADRTLRNAFVGFLVWKIICQTGSQSYQLCNVLLQSYS